MAEAQSYATVDALPEAARPLLEAAPFLSGAAWWRCVQAASLPPGSTPRFVLCCEAGRAVALVPLLVAAGGELSGLSTPYTVTWQPLLAANADPAAVARVGRALAGWARGWATLRLEALDPAWPRWTPLLAGLRRGGFLRAQFEHFANWHEPIAGRDWPAYLAGRPGALRETVRRKQARTKRDPSLALQCVRTPEAVEAGIAGYLDVYRRSWKVAEPFPEFDAALLRAAAAAGVLRLGLLWRDGVAVAAQYWIVSQGIASVLKLAHDEAHRALSPGTVLTAWMIRGLIEEGVQALDFGRGDDPYKQLWTTQRRPRTGLVLAQPWRPAGLAALARQHGGAAVRRLRTAIGGALSRP